MSAATQQKFIHPDISIEGFESGDVDPDRFDHEAHVYAGWLYVSEFETVEAIARFDRGLKCLVDQFGATGKYHATLTWFFLLLIADRATEGEPWAAFKQRNADLITGSQELLSRYYSNEYLFSERAREQFLLPDKLANNNSEA